MGLMTNDILLLRQRHWGKVKPRETFTPFQWISVKTTLITFIELKISYFCTNWLYNVPGIIPLLK